MNVTRPSYSNTLRRLTLRALVLAYVTLITTTVRGDGTVDEPSLSRGGIYLKYATRQLERLSKIPAPCFVRLIGNAQSADVVIALDLQSNDCGTQAADTTTSIRVIALKPAGLNLIRVEQNFGGTYNLVRYAIVSLVIQSIPSDSGITENLVLVRRALLPPEDIDQAVAVRKASKFAAVLSSRA